MTLRDAVQDPSTRSATPPPGLLAVEPASPPGSRVVTVLVVEDSRVSADAARLMLRACGVRMRRADSLGAAWRHLTLYRPDAVLVDMGLPDGLGLALIETLRRCSAPAPLIIATSGYAELEHPARDAGADVFLAKPVESVSVLRRALAPLLGAGGASGAWSAAASLEPARPRMPWLGHRAPAGSTDPVALRDDLLSAARRLEHAPDGDGLSYVTQFLGSLARCTGDSALRALADAARHTARGHLLLRALHARIDAQPLL